MRSHISYRSWLSRRLALFPAAALVAAALGCREDAESPTSPEPATGLAPSATAALTFSAISAGGDHSCALVSDGRAYCWGSNLDGQLGDGTNTDRLTPTPVAGGLRFLQISAGAGHTCGITKSERAYCWGADPLGSNVGNSTTPRAVAGDRRFRNVNAGNNHTCAVTPSDVGFCWGLNSFGQLGTGGGFSATPARIAGGLRWRRVTAGGQYSCGVTTDDRAYCWGFNVGPTPVAVEGGLRFRQVVAGGGGFTDAQHMESDLPHACGVTTGDRAYCWHYGSEGQLGDGTRTFRTRTPVAVAGSRRWRQVIAGSYHTCGVTMADTAFCWGLNQTGANGDGSTAMSTKPTRVQGDLRFRGISTGIRGGHTCALRPDGKAYCWGANGSGQLGDGTRTRRLAPVAVAGTT